MSSVCLNCNCDSKLSHCCQVKTFSRFKPRVGETKSRKKGGGRKNVDNFYGVQEQTMILFQGQSLFLKMSLSISELRTSQERHVRSTKTQLRSSKGQKN